MSLMEQLHGILIIDKPGGMSSAQCVGRIKRLGQKKIGHAGTLDPMATGVLIVCLVTPPNFPVTSWKEGKNVMKASPVSVL